MIESGHVACRLGVGPWTLGPDGSDLVNVDVDAGDATLKVSVRDNGVGGAACNKGTGLIGLQDRVEALGGHMDIASPAGCGTALLVKIPTSEA